MDGPVGVLRDLVGVGARGPGRRHALERALAVEGRPVERAAGGILRRGQKVGPTAGGVHQGEVSDIVVAGGDLPHLIAVPGDQVEVAPAVALRQPGEISISVEPLRVVVHVDPGLVVIGEHGAKGAARDVTEHHLGGVLQPVEADQPDLARTGCPPHLGDVEVSRVALGLEPGGGAAAGGDDPDPARRVGGPHLGIGQRRQLGVDGIGVVDEVEGPHSRRVELPVGDVAAVGAPAETVAEAELLLVDPVGCAVDDVLAVIGGQPCHLEGLHVLDVEILVVETHPRRHLAVGRQLGEHHGRLCDVAAQFSQHTAVEVEQPVVAARIASPHSFGVGEDQKL